MSITERAREAAEQGGNSWMKKPEHEYAEHATAALTAVLDGDPGPCQVLVYGTKPYDAHTHNLPAELLRGRRNVARFVVEGTEVVGYHSPNDADWRFYVVERSQNPMEEARLGRFSDLAAFGELV